MSQTPRERKPPPTRDRNPNDPEDVIRDRIINDDDLEDPDNPTPQPDVDPDEIAPAVKRPPGAQPPPMSVREIGIADAESVDPSLLGDAWARMRLEVRDGERTRTIRSPDEALAFIKANQGLGERGNTTGTIRRLEWGEGDLADQTALAAFRAWLEANDLLVMRRTATSQ